jgi:hypothetical protein
MYAAVSAACVEELVKSCFMSSFRASVKTYEIVQLCGGHTSVYTRDDLLGNGHRVDMVCVETVTQSGDTGCDLVELNALLASIFGSHQLPGSFRRRKDRIHTALLDIHREGRVG